MKIVSCAVDLVRTAAAGVAGIPAAEHAGTVAAAGPERPVWGWSKRNSSPVWGYWPGHVCNDPVKTQKGAQTANTSMRWLVMDLGNRE